MSMYLPALIRKFHASEAIMQANLCQVGYCEYSMALIVTYNVGRAGISS